ncbi:SRPBCC family protein [Thalassotalea agarivorans]|nr:hypothetical protein [Thalassotalea agarivorans]
MIKIIVICFALCPFIAAGEQSERDWEIHKKNKHASVAFRPSEFDKLIEVQAQFTIDSTLSGFLLFLQDTDHIPNWVASARKSHLVEQHTPTKNSFLTTFDTLWPFSNRYMYVDSDIVQNQDLSIEINVRNSKHPIPKHIDVESLTAIDVKRAKWIVKPTSDKKLAITYQIVADPGGVVPYWLSNKFALNNMWRSIVSIQQQLPQSRWQQHRHSALIEKKLINATVPY